MNLEVAEGRLQVTRSMNANKNTYSAVPNNSTGTLIFNRAKFQAVCKYITGTLDN